MVAARRGKPRPQALRRLAHIAHCGEAHELDARLHAGARLSGDSLAGTPFWLDATEYAVASSLRSCSIRSDVWTTIVLFSAQTGDFVARYSLAFVKLGV
jgi:hypothetical protein